jgi:hypothetical protein
MSWLTRDPKPSTVHAVSIGLLLLCGVVLAAPDVQPVPEPVTDCSLAATQPSASPLCRTAVKSMVVGWKTAALGPLGASTAASPASRSGLEQRIVFTDSLRGAEPLVVYRVTSAGRSRAGNSLRLVKRSGNVELVY